MQQLAHHKNGFVDEGTQRQVVVRNIPVVVRNKQVGTGCQ